ncbi:MAG TPA: MFS transporter [Conexibacter sp.]
MSAATSGPRGSRTRGAGLLIVGLLLVALNLRFALTGVGPLVDDIRRDTALSGTAVGLLSTAPLLALGLVSPFAPRLAARFGAEQVIFGCMLVIAAGVLLRWLPPVALLFAGSVLAGCAIAIGNVLMPGIVKRRFADRAALMTGVYSAGLSVGGSLSAGLAVPIEDAFNGNWHIALAIWALPALVAAVAWLPQLRVWRPAATSVSPPARPAVSLWRDRRAWAVTVFMGLQSLIYYAGAAWLPSILQDRGLSDGAAGGLLSIVLIVGIPFGLATAALSGRMRNQGVLAVVSCMLPVIGWLGLLLGPDALAVPATVVLGIGVSTAFPLALTLIVLRGRDARQTAALSSMAQTFGYTVAALGPLSVGALHDVSGGWSLPLVVLIALVIPELIAALVASRPGFVGERACQPAAPAPAG